MNIVQIRLLTSVHGGGAVDGDPGDILEVDSATARVWADGERAERVRFSKNLDPEPVSRVSLVKVHAPAGPSPARPARGQRRSQAARR